MSANLNTVAVKLYDSQVKQAYQDDSKLRGTVYTKSAKSADEIKFRNMGKGLAATRATHTTGTPADVTPMNVSNSLVNCPLINIVAAEYTDVFGQSEVNFSDVNELSRAISSAMGRSSDQLILDALANTTSTKVGTTGTALTVDTMLAAKRALDAKGVPASDRCFVIESKGMEDLLKTTQVTSTDYNSVKALVAGDVNTFLGFKIIQIADRAEGGISNDGTDFTGFAYHNRAVGYGLNLDISTKVDWIPEKLAWLSVGKLKAGSVIIDNDGVIPIVYGI